MGKPNNSSSENNLQLEKINISFFQFVSRTAKRRKEMCGWKSIALLTLVVCLVYAEEGQRNDTKRMQNDVAQVEDVVGTYDRKGSNEWGKVHLRYTYAIPL